MALCWLQRLPGDLNKNIDEILAEVDKDKNGEVDYDEVRLSGNHQCCMLFSRAWHDLT